jgi:hypothetical protein
MKAYSYRAAFTFTFQADADRTSSTESRGSDAHPVGLAAVEAF